MKNAVYLDHAAATPMDEGVLVAMQSFFARDYYNPSATYLAARAVRQATDQARTTVAQILGVRPAEIIFTAGGTEANNLAIKGTAAQFPGSHMVGTALEHDSVRYPLQYVQAQGLNYSEVLPSANGVVDVDSVTKAITDKTVLVSVMYANNEIGTIQPIREISHALQVIRAERQKAGNNTPLYLHTDACQAANYLDLHVSRLGVDLMTLNGGKIYGPKQSGMLYVASHVQLTPLIHGGGQERTLRSGTENVAGIVGFGEALKQAQAMRHSEVERLKKLQILFISQLEQAISGVVINGSRKNRLPNNVHITIPGTDNERLIFGLDEAGIQAAAGSACSASSDEPSHVLTAIGLSDAEAQASLRFTMGRSTDEAVIDQTVATLTKLIAS